VSPSDKTVVEIEGRELTLSNLEKPLYPTGFTKADLVHYYVEIAPVLLPHLKGRPVTVRRYPNGVKEAGFIAKNVPNHAPKWVPTVVLPRKGTGWGAKKDPERDTTEYMLVADLATLVWLANLAVVELHTPMWRVGRDNSARSPDLLVFDLDPGKPADIHQCCEVALLLKEKAAGEKIELFAKTSGSKGLQCYGRIASRRWPPERSNEFAHQMAEELEGANRHLIVSKMAKELRPGKVLIDWSQNNMAKTTATVYSMRAVDKPSVSTPVSWEEVEACAASRSAELSFGPDQVLERVEKSGDLFAPLC
jgi:bifunctional non-homologous end joining protein LigD